MDRLDMVGQACPVPVITTKKALDAAGPGAAVEVIVDNATAVENLTKFAEQRGYALERGPQDPGRFVVQITRPETDAAAAVTSTQAAGPKTFVVAVSSRTMGEGDERLGATLLKGFLYALTEQDRWPTAVLFYNGGAFSTTEGSESLEDLRKLEAGGVEILTCGTCLNHYGLADSLAVGGVTNMYSIVELLASADSVLKP